MNPFTLSVVEGPAREAPCSVKRTLAILVALTSLGAAATPVCTPFTPSGVEGPSDGSAPVVDRGLPEGPISLGYFEADLGAQRRACPRSEVGIGGRFSAIIDRPNFYGNLGVNGLVFGSWAVNDKTEIFATLEAVNFTYAVNASIELTQIKLGHMTAGVTRVVHGSDSALAGSVSARLLLPTSFELPNARLIGAELSYLVEFRPFGWLGLHGAAGFDFTTAISTGSSYPRFGATPVLGAELRPTSWFAFVLDLTAHFGNRNYFAPVAALRFRIASLGIELGGSLPVFGTDRHDFLFAGRFTWRL